MAKRAKKRGKKPPAPNQTRFATAHNDITIPRYTDVLSFIDDTLLERGGGKGLKLYDEIERDTHAWSVLQKRKHQLVGREWIVEPASEGTDDVAAADFIREQLAGLPFDRICLDLLDATLKGFSIAEIVYGRDGRHVTVDEVANLEQRRFVFDPDWKPRLLTMAAPTKGETLPDRKFVVHRFGVKGNNPYGLGLGTRLFWPALFKRNGVAFWMKFLERFASPIPVGKYPMGSLPAQQRDLMMVLEGMNHASAITVPIGTELDSFESKRTGRVDYDAWCRFWNAEMSKATLGETLTTEMGQTGARAASETHADILDMLVDSDADLLSGTLNMQLVSWLSAFNYPNARPPAVWRPRPSNEMEQEELAHKRAERRAVDMEALAQARELGFEPENVEAYMARVFDGPVRAVTATGSVAVSGSEAQKKTSEPKPDVAFADAGSFSLEDLTKALEALVRETHESWVADLRALVDQAEHGTSLRQAMLDWQASLPEPPYAEALGDAIALAGLKGRAEIIDEISGPELAEPTIGTVTFRQAQDFLRQKVSLPTNAWTDTLHQAHDRAFVVAGADSVALVEDLRAALDDALDGGGGLKGFRERFDAIVLKHGWDYRGGRNWRTRVIFETNLRTAHQAGRLKQMRDPDVVAVRPFWQYVHAVTRVPKTPRKEHKALDGRVLRHDDPAWERIYPPNGWMCSCGVNTLSAAGLKRLGKDGPDPTPTLKMRKVKDPVTGEWVEVPQGIDFGWDYQPGDSWERGLVPREWQKPLSLAEPELPLPVSPSLDEIGRPFASPQLPKGKSPEYYVGRFLSKFGAAIGRGVLYRDRAGQAVLVSDALFRTMDGSWKAMKRGRAVQMERLAEAIFDPDEIWVDWSEDQDGNLRLVRRYLRWDPQLAGFGVFEWSQAGWSGLTAFDPQAGSRHKPSRTYLEKHRRGALIYRRGEEERE